MSSMSVDETISDVTTANLQLGQHQQLWAELEAREETYQRAVDMGEELQSLDRSYRKEVRTTVTDRERETAATRKGFNSGSGSSGTGEAGSPAGRT